MADDESTATHDEQAEDTGGKRSGVAAPNVLQRDSDRPARPGFRNPPNARSKAQKKTRKKR